MLQTVLGNFLVIFNKNEKTWRDFFEDYRKVALDS
jgi:hypothetical protein